MKLKNWIELIKSEKLQDIIEDVKVSLIEFIFMLEYFFTL